MASVLAILPKRLLDAVLLLAVVGAVQCDGATDQEIPVWAMLDDEMQVGDLLEIVLDALRPLVGAIVDDRLPALVRMQGEDIAHAGIRRLAVIIW